MEVREPSAKYLVPQTGRDLPDWQNVKLGDVASFRTGPFGSALHKSDYVYGGVPVVNPMQIENGRIKPTERMSVAEEAAERLGEFRLQSGDVVIGRRGEMGRCAFIQDAQEGWLCGTGSMIVRPGVMVDGRFLQRVLSSNQAVRAIESASVGTTMINLNQRTLAELSLRLPVSVDEQSSIATALTDADALIDSLEQLLTKKRQIKQGAMQELLTGQRRLPGFIGKWEDRTLGDLADIRSGGTPSTRQPEFWGGDIPWCTPTDITSLAGAKYIAQTERSISGKGLKASSAEALPVGTVVMTSRATIGECAIASVPLTTNQGFKNFVPHSHTNGEFLYYLLGTQKSAFLALCSGSTFLEIGKRQLADFVVRCPVELDEQRAIADALSTMDTELTTLESRLTKARALKQAMAQALLTGRIRLIEPST
jgi:type I restriction enzyme S subunit